jgi:hypothetical protein
VFGAAGAAVGGTAGFVAGGTGGTLVAPGVGTVGGAVAGAAAGAELGTVVGAAVGATVDVVASINWGKVVRGIGLIGGLLGGDAGAGLSKRLLDIEKPQRIESNVRTRRRGEEQAVAETQILNRRQSCSRKSREMVDLVGIRDILFRSVPPCER